MGVIQDSINSMLSTLGIATKFSEGLENNRNLKAATKNLEQHRSYQEEQAKLAQEKRDAYNNAFQKEGLTEEEAKNAFKEARRATNFQQSLVKEDVNLLNQKKDALIKAGKYKEAADIDREILEKKNLGNKTIVPTFDTSYKSKWSKYKKEHQSNKVNKAAVGTNISSSEIEAEQEKQRTQKSNIKAIKENLGGNK